LAEIVRKAAVVSAEDQFACDVGKAMEQRYPLFEASQGSKDGCMRASQAALTQVACRRFMRQVGMSGQR
jgi:hypothetical protein